MSDHVAVEPHDLIPLKTYRINPRKARIELRGAAAELFLPPYFGRRRLCVPLDALNVCDLTSPFLAESPGEDVFREVISIPYLFTTGPATAPTLLLLFTSPQQVPPLRAIASLAPNVDLPFGWKSTRSRRGAFIDGVLLRAPDAADASRRLVEAGAIQVNDPAGWLREHRDRVTNPEEMQQVIADDARRTLLARVAAGAFYASLVGAVVITGAEQLPLALLGLPAAVAAASLGIRRAITR